MNILCQIFANTSDQTDKRVLHRTFQPFYVYFQRSFNGSKKVGSPRKTERKQALTLSTKVGWKVRDMWQAWVSAYTPCVQGVVVTEANTKYGQGSGTHSKISPPLKAGPPEPILFVRDSVNTLTHTKKISTNLNFRIAASHFDNF